MIKRKDTQLIVERWRRFINEGVENMTFYTFQNDENISIEEKFKNGVTREHYTSGLYGIKAFWLYPDISKAWRAWTTTSYFTAKTNENARIITVTLDSIEGLIPDLENLLGVKDYLIWDLVAPLFKELNKGAKIITSGGSDELMDPPIEYTVLNARSWNKKDRKLTSHGTFLDNNVVVNVSSPFNNNMPISLFKDKQTRIEHAGVFPGSIFDEHGKGIQGFGPGNFEFQIINALLTKGIKEKTLNLNKEILKESPALAYAGDTSNINIESILTLEEFKSKLSL